MKAPLVIAFLTLAVFATASAEEEGKIAPRSYETLPRFGIPNEFYSDHYYSPVAYLQRYQVENKEAVLARSEKISAALLVIAADHATTEKYHQSYGVSMNSPLMVLLAKNFSGISKIDPMHDVEPDHLPIRDLGAFFRAWLEQELSEEAQAVRIKGI